VPNASRIGLLGNPNNPSYSSVLKIAQSAAKRAGFSLLPIEARSPQEIEDAFVTLARERVPAVMFAGDAVFFQQQHRIAELALANRLATMFSQREYVVAGGLMSYGEDVADFYHRAPFFIDKIFKGAKPGDLPIEQPTKFNLVINLKTAKALGLTISRDFLLIADEVIE
jgi:putative tryptophan/tyrosine transport system substrate-binding protein